LIFLEDGDAFRSGIASLASWLAPSRSSRLAKFASKNTLIALILIPFLALTQGCGDGNSTADSDRPAGDAPSGSDEDEGVYWAYDCGLGNQTFEIRFYGIRSRAAIVQESERENFDFAGVSNAQREYYVYRSRNEGSARAIEVPNVMVDDYPATPTGHVIEEGTRTECQRASNF
jgi:hypothetical protein